MENEVPEEMNNAEEMSLSKHRENQDHAPAELVGALGEDDITRLLALSVESRDTYLRELPQLIKEHAGEFVLIVGHEVMEYSSSPYGFGGRGGTVFHIPLTEEEAEPGTTYGVLLPSGVFSGGGG